MVAITNIQTKFSVPNSFDESQRVQAARMIIDRIHANSTLGLNKYGSAFPSYTIEYRRSKDFKNAGKSSLPNLQLSGDMLAGLSLISHSTGVVTIGYRSSDPDAGKVEGNQIGSYGKDPNPVHSRPFIGLPQSQLDLIIAEVASNSTQLEAGITGIVDNLLGRFN